MKHHTGPQIYLKKNNQVVVANYIAAPSHSHSIFHVVSSIHAYARGNI
jgi:hypothetical protein